MATLNHSAAVRKDALSALQLWQTFEYLSPQEPPDEKQAELDCVWNLDPRASDDAQMPWHDLRKIEDLTKFFKKAKNRRFQLFAGVISGTELIETARRLLGAPEIDFAEQKDPRDVASFMIPLDKFGYVAGDIFVSSVPWALKCIEEAQEAQKKDPRKLFNFSGFFGLNGVERNIKDKVRALLLKRQLIEDESERVDRIEIAAKDAKNPRGTQLGTRHADATQAGPKAAVVRNVRTLGAEDVRKIAEVVFSECGWTPTGEGAWAIKAEQAPEDGHGRQPEDPLNSFFAEDLETVQGAYLSGQGGAPLTKFLEMQQHPQRIDLEGDRKHLINGVHPGITPAACWPGEYPLVTAQQFAVNAIMRDLAQGGLFSVNGPPGTGKTTMLKEIVAAVVCQRAVAMVKFNSPLDAFTAPLVIEDDPSDHKFGVPQLLHESLRGFGIVVACSGNVAAENISMELPGKKTIDSSIQVDYFSEVANSMGLPEKAKQRGDKRWGLVSAPLGNSSNRSAFTSSFWFGPKKTPEEKAVEKKRLEEIPKDPLRLMTIQNWVKEFRGTVPDWSTAQKRFEAALERSNAARTKAASFIKYLQQYEQLSEDLVKWMSCRPRVVQEIQQLQLHLKDAKDSSDSAESILANAKNIEEALQALSAKQIELTECRDTLVKLDSRKSKHAAVDIKNSIEATERGRNRLLQDIQAMAHTRPSWLMSLLRPKTARQWEERQVTLMDVSKSMRDTLDELELQVVIMRKWESARDKAMEDEGELAQEVANLRANVSRLGVVPGYTLAQAKIRRQSCALELQEANARLHELREKIKEIEGELKTSDERIKFVEQQIKECRDALDGTGLLDGKHKSWHLREFSREEFHKTSPYQNTPDLFDARRELFVAAMDLHKAFIVHSWSKLRPTLNAMVGMLSGQVKPQNVHAGPMALWDTLFLVVPLISTTFASFPRLFRGVGRENLAWVLIDEAGQAAPQACVGALWRAKRAVIVGDPIQLEPIVGVPQELVWPLQSRCGTPKQYVPPKASVQTMADFSNQFGMQLKSGESGETLWLGSPLVVHRRCLDPMFTIANTIAYEGKMVHGSGAEHPGNKNLCSQWIHVPAEGADEHWIPAQGQRALDKVWELVGNEPVDDEGQANVYVITPFKSVAKKMREVLQRELEWDKKVAERLCGTVHTFQGKEARDVIFLLGGNPTKHGVISTFAGKNPNLINVAATRAKKRLYVIGDRNFWTSHHDTKGFYSTMAEMLDDHVATAPIPASVEAL